MLDKLIAGAVQETTSSQGAADNSMMQVIGSLLSNGGPYGGLPGLVQQFQQAGLGQQAGSWVSTGANLPISPEQLSRVFGGAELQQMAATAGMEASQFGARLSQLLPQMIDQLTPDGRMPTGGVEDPLAALSSLLRR